MRREDRVHVAQVEAAVCELLAGVLVVYLFLVSMLNEEHFFETRLFVAIFLANFKNLLRCILESFFNDCFYALYPIFLVAPQCPSQFSHC